MCLVEMSNSPGGKLDARLPDAAGRGHGRQDRHAAGEGPAARRCWSSCSSTTRSTAPSATRPASASCRTTTCSTTRSPRASTSPRSMKGKRKVLGPAGRARPGALHPLHPLRPLHARGGQGAAARRRAAAAPTSVITTFPGQPLDYQVLGQHRRHLPGGRADLHRLPLPRPGLVHDRGAARSAPAARAAATSSSTSSATTTYRYRPRENEAVNQEWMCDEGRLTYKYLNAERVAGGAARAAGRAARGRRRARRCQGRGAALQAAAPGRARWRCSLSPLASLEDLLAAAAVASEALGAGRGLRGRPAGGLAATSSSRRPTRTPTAGGWSWSAQAFGLAVQPFAELAGADRGGQGEGASGRSAPRCRDAGGGRRRFGRARGAGRARRYERAALAGAGARVLLPASPHAEDDGTFVNFEGRAQRFERAYSPRGDVPAALGAGRRPRPRARAHPALAGAPARSSRDARARGSAARSATSDWDSLPSVRPAPGHHAAGRRHRGRPAARLPRADAARARRRPRRRSRPSR